MYKSQSVRRSILAVSLLAMTIGSLPAEARVGSSSSSSSRSSASVSRPSFTSSAPSRIGGGRSLGIQRQSVMSSVRSAPAQIPAPLANVTRPSSPSMPMAPGAAAPVKKDRSWVAPALAGAAVGAAATYALSDHGTHQAPPQHAPAPAQPQYAPQYMPQQPQYMPQQQPQYAPQAGQGYNGGVQGGYAAPMAAPAMAPAAAPQSSSGFGFGTVLLLLALGGIGFVAYRLVTTKQGSTTPSGFKPIKSVAPVASGSSDFAATAKQLFIDLQNLNNAGDMDALKLKTTPDIYEALAHDIHSRDAASTTSVVQLNAEVVDEMTEGARRIVSVRFIGLVSESPDRAPDAVDEVWHFVQESGDACWKVAGIEQV